MAGHSLHRIPAGGEREQFLPLLLLADESQAQVRSYMQEGDLYVFRAPGSNAAMTAGIVLAIPIFNNH